MSYGKFPKELQVFKQLEDSLTHTSVFWEIKTTSGASVLDDMVSTMKKNMSVFDIVRNGDSFLSIESALKNQWFDDVLTDLKNSVHWGKDLAKVKTVTGNIIETNMNKSLFLAEDSFSTWRKFFGNKVKLPWSKFPYEVELIQKMRDFSKLQGKMLQSDAMFNDVRNLFRNFKKGKLLAGMVEYSDDIKFTLSNVDDAKHFFDNVRTIWRRSPEILKTLFKGFPLIMMWREIMDKISDPNNDEPAIHSIRDGFMYLTPLVGPIKLISDGLTIKDGNFVSLSSAWVGLGLFTIDGYFALKSIPKKEFLKFMTMPIRDSVSFVKSIAKWSYLSLKMLADGVRIIRAGKTAELWIESLRLLKSSWLKIASVALLCYLGYEIFTDLFDNASEEERQQLAEIAKMDTNALQAKIQKEWPSMTDEQKSTLIKLATVQRMWLTDITKVDTQKQWNTIAIRFWTLVNYHTMKEVEQDLQTSLWQLEATKDIRLHFTLDGWEIKYELLDWKKSKFLDDTWSFDQEAMRNYLMTMWYTLELTEKLLKTIA
jgi:hypothetical protein